MMEALLQTAPLMNWAQMILNGDGAHLRIKRIKPEQTDNWVKVLVDVVGQDDGAVQQEIDGEVVKYVAKYELDRGKVVYVLLVSCQVSRVVAESGCFLIHADSRGSGGMEWLLLYSNFTELKDLMKNLNGLGQRIRVLLNTKYERKEALTARQEQIVRIALEKGYFDYPRKTALMDMANPLEVSAAALLEILRRGEKKILQEYFKEAE